MQSYKLKQLEGGGRVVSEKLPSVRSISLGFWIGAGSRYEQPGENGVSHFIEHLLFKGGSRHDAVEIAQIFDSFGGELNAATAREYTVVHARFLDEHLEEAFEVMADMVLRPVFADIDLEREVVVEEIAMYEDSPGELITDYLTQALFDGHPLGKSVLGTTKIIGAITPDQIRGYHGSHYTLPNMVVAAAGNVDQEPVVELAQRHLAAGNAAAAPVAVKPGPLGTATSACFYEKDTQQYHVCFGGPGLSRHSGKRFTLSILDGILGGSASSRLFREVRDKRGLAYSVYSYDTLYSDTGLIGIYFGCRGDSVAAVTGIVAEQIESLINHGVGVDELARAKESAKGRMVLGMETTHNRMSRLGKLTVTGSEILSLDGIIEHIEAVTADDVQSLAREFYQPDELVAVAIGPDVRVFEAALDVLGGRREMEVKVG